MKLTCYHVQTSDGQMYGAAATAKRDAMSFVQDRLTRDGSPAKPIAARSVGGCDWTYGNVLHYGPVGGE